MQLVLSLEVLVLDIAIQMRKGYLCFFKKTFAIE